MCAHTKTKKHGYTMNDHTWACALHTLTQTHTESWLVSHHRTRCVALPRRPQGPHTGRSSHVNETLAHEFDVCGPTCGGWVSPLSMLLLLSFQGSWARLAGKRWTAGESETRENTECRFKDAVKGSTRRNRYISRCLK